MDFTIRRVVLYPENANLPPRIVNFEPGRINIITGTSQRGKSAVSKIIDYCLGASKCAIPVGIIRDTTSWFAVEVIFKDSYMFLARKSPKNLNSSRDCYIEVKTDPIVLPQSIEKNSSLDLLVSRINEQIGLPNITLQPHAPESYNAPPSFRDLVAFNYLPQHIVANPYVLFVRTERTEHKERLKRMFPLALSIVDNKYYTLLSEQEILQKNITEIKDKIVATKVMANKIREDIIPYIKEAIELGLIEKHFDFNNLPKAIDRLRKVTDESKDISTTNYFKGQIADAVEELVHLIDEEDKIAKEIEKMRRQLSRYRQLGGYMAQYSDELDNQIARVGILSWFRNNISGNSSCVLCGSPSSYSRQEIEWLKKTMTSIESELNKIAQAPVRLDKDVVSIQQKISNLQDKMMSLRNERAELESKSKDAEEARFSFQQVNQFIGRMQQAITHIDYSDESSEINLSLKDYEKKLKSVKSQIAKYQITKELNESFFLIGHNTQKFAKHLGLERVDSKIEFDRKELMLGFYRTDTPDEKEKVDFLFEIGSGENWMGYHVAFFLSLHEKFVENQKSPVFSFLIIDQPTQVYFPSNEMVSTYDRRKNHKQEVQIDSHKTNSEKSTISENSESEERIQPSITATRNLAGSIDNFDIDVKKARRIFEILSQSLKNMKERYQIIVTEHADEDVWGDIDLVHRVADWRGDDSENYLIPLEWINTMMTVQKELPVLPSNQTVPNTSDIAKENTTTAQTNIPKKTLFGNIKGGEDTESS